MGAHFRRMVKKQIEIEAKYEGYIKRQQDADQENENNSRKLGFRKGLQYGDIPSLSNELKIKLTAVEPATIGQAQRIPGMTPGRSHGDSDTHEEDGD